MQIIRHKELEVYKRAFAHLTEVWRKRELVS